jgi:hypothetical protein
MNRGQMRMYIESKLLANKKSSIASILVKKASEEGTRSSVAS